MCGIFVCREEYQYKELGTKAIEHRGSMQNSVSYDGYFFFHRLHSVVGHNVIQPFKGKGILVANCEIYNWKSIAEQKGFKCRNDAELLFLLLEETDISNSESILNTIDLLDGDFACVYYRDGIFIIFRDIFGVNPLFYSLDPFIICSERKAARFTRELHPRHIIVYDTHRNVKTTISNSFNRLLSNKVFPTYSSVKETLFKAIDKRIAKVPSGILFSGGIDSTIIALRMREMGNEPRLYTAYTGNFSEDLKYSEQFSNEYSFKHEVIEVSRDDIIETIPKICRFIESAHPVKVSVALPMYFACYGASKNHEKVIYSGLGADDLFCGYARFSGSTNIHNEQMSSIYAIYERDLYRDNVIAMVNNLELRVPFLDKSLFLQAYNLDENQLNKKHFLRELLMKHYGVDQKFYTRPKRAAQYGSGFMEELRQVSKAHNTPLGKYLANIYPEKSQKIAALYTGGKDSAYAIYLIKSMNYSVECLISILPENPHSYMYHLPDQEVIKKHAIQMHLPVIFRKSSGIKEQELQDLESAISEAMEQYNIEGVVTGAISSDYQRTRIEKVCEKLGVRVFSPLWHTDQVTYLKNIIANRFRFKIISVSAEGLDNSWVGTEITSSNIDYFINQCIKHGINPAGEGGEYETEVISGPLFSD